MRQRALPCLVIFGLTLLSGCGSSGSNNGSTNAPAISSLSPTAGPAGTTVTITGTNFGSSQGTSEVTFNGSLGSPTSWSDTSIVVPVPNGATSGNVVVNVSGTASNGSSFSVILPVITGLSPTEGSVGSTVTISGSSFGATQGTSTVTFNGTAALVVSWSDTSIVVEVAAGTTTGSVVVTANGELSNSASFTVTGSSVSGCGTGNDAILSGSYGYYLSGFEGGGAGSPVVRAGSFTADGQGDVILSSGNANGGEEDFNAATNGDNHRTIVASGSSYSVGPDNRGCLTLKYSDGSTTVFRFSLGTQNNSNQATQGRIIESDDTTGAGTHPSGVLLLQSTTAFAAASLQSGYAFGLEGFDPAGNHVALGGSFALSNGSISGGYLDYNDAGTMPFGANGTAGASSGSVAVGSITTTTGRTTATFTTGTASSLTFHWVVYIVNANQWLLISQDTLGAGTPLVGGRVLSNSRGSFPNTFLNGNYILEGSGATSGLAAVQLDLVTFSSNGFSSSGSQYGLSLNPSVNTINVSGTYSVDSTSGRVALQNASGASVPILYLVTPPGLDVVAFVIGTDNAATAGSMVLQSAPSFASGPPYVLATLSPDDNTVQVQSGVGIFQTAVLGGTLTGTLDQDGTGGLTTVTFSGIAYQVFGDGTATASDGNGGTIFAIVNGTQFFSIDENPSASPPQPAVIVAGQQ